MESNPAHLLCEIYGHLIDLSGHNLDLLHFAQSHIASIVTTIGTIVNCLGGQNQGFFR